MSIVEEFRDVARYDVDDGGMSQTYRGRYVEYIHFAELLAHIGRLESALALAEKAIGGECDIANNCDLCQAYQAIQDIKSGGSLGAAARQEQHRSSNQ